MISIVSIMMHIQRANQLSGSKF